MSTVEEIQSRVCELEKRMGAIEVRNSLDLKRKEIERSQAVGDAELLRKENDTVIMCFSLPDF